MKCVKGGFILSVCIFALHLNIGVVILIINKCYNIILVLSTL